LITVSQQQSAYIGAVAGMSESKSFLEERIKLMVSKRPKGWRVSAAALAGLALSLVAVAAEGPPNGGGEHAEFVIEPSVLDRYVGFYKLSETYVFTVTRQGSKLFAKLTGQGAAQIYPESETKFFYKVVKAQIDFVADSSGNISSLVLHQNGADHTAPRVEEAVAEQIDGSLTARIQAQTPMPGSEAAVQSLLAGEASGKPDYDRMSPELATAVRQQLSNVQANLAPLGPVLAVEFVSVGAQGWDTYLIKHEHGVSQVRIILNDKGIIVGAYHTTGP
jgi:bla regulator protein blaR1